MLRLGMFLTCPQENQFLSPLMVPLQPATDFRIEWKPWKSRYCFSVVRFSEEMQLDALIKVGCQIITQL